MDRENRVEDFMIRIIQEKEISGKEWGPENGKRERERVRREEYSPDRDMRSSETREVAETQI